MGDAEELFEDAIRWLQDEYDDRPFYVERDIVYTLQSRLWDCLRARGLDWTVHNDWPMIPGPRRSLSADLAIRDGSGNVLLVAEFKYEPSHSRPEIPKNKFPVVIWADALKDVDRIRKFVELGRAKVAYAVLVDEGGYFRHREPLPTSRWVDWKTRTPRGHPVSILWSKWPSDS